MAAGLHSLLPHTHNLMDAALYLQLLVLTAVGAWMHIPAYHMCATRLAPCSQPTSITV